MLHKISPGFHLKTGAQYVKKASQSFASADAKALLYVFCRDMCVAENTLRGVSVELSAISGQQRRRTQRSFLEKVVKPLFRQSQPRFSYENRGLFIFCYFLKLSFSATERLNTRWPGFASLLSRQK